jgi:hypothetical protein
MYRYYNIGCSFNILATLPMEIFCFCLGMSSFELPVSKIRVHSTVIFWYFRSETFNVCWCSPCSTNLFWLKVIFAIVWMDLLRTKLLRGVYRRISHCYLLLTVKPEPVCRIQWISEGTFGGANLGGLNIQPLITTLIYIPSDYKWLKENSGLATLMRLVVQVFSCIICQSFLLRLG